MSPPVRAILRRKRPHNLSERSRKETNNAVLKPMKVYVWEGRKNKKRESWELKTRKTGRPQRGRSIWEQADLRRRSTNRFKTVDSDYEAKRPTGEKKEEREKELSKQRESSNLPTVFDRPPWWNSPTASTLKGFPDIDNSFSFKSYSTRDHRSATVGYLKTPRQTQIMSNKIEIPRRPDGW